MSANTKTGTMDIAPIGLTWVKPKKRVTIVEKFTIEQFSTYMAPKVDLNPIGQRNAISAKQISTGRKATKAQSIIGAIFTGYDLCEIQLAVRISNGGFWNSVKDFQIVESLDGGHRKRSIKDYIAGKFPTHKSSPIGQKYFKELTPDQMEYFLGYELTFKIFTNLTDKEIGQQFRQTNNVDSLNFAETMNSYGLLLQIAALRRLTMVVNESGEEIDEVLPWFEKAPDRAFDNTRMQYLEQILESAVLHTNGFGTVTHDDIIEFIENDMSEKEVKSVIEKVKKEYNFYNSIAPYFKRVTKKRISVKDFHIFRIVYFNLLDKSARFKVEDYQGLGEAIADLQADWLYSCGSDGYVDDNGYDLDAKLKTIGAAYASYVKKIGNTSSFLQAVEWVDEWLKVDEFVTFKGADRVFPTDMLRKKWREIGKINEVTGEPIAWEDVVGAHIVPDSENGPITYENLMITDAYHNEKMGTQNALVYAHNWRKDNNVVVDFETAKGAA